MSPNRVNIFEKGTTQLCRSVVSLAVTRLNRGGRGGVRLACSLGWLIVEHNCVNIGVFIDFVEQQLHVSAFIGHRQVVLREVNEFH